MDPLPPPPFPPDQCYGDAFGVLRPATVYKSKKKGMVTK